ncbi:MAG: T9SS type A sorting domain-containing protein [Chitinophagales bacterium]|nr:T9SS type A sorting domain-containing protein [Chitinophagales bacterium]
MIKSIIFIVIYGSYHLIAFSQIPQISWENSYGGSNSDDLYSIDTTNDGGFIAAGLAYSEDGDVTQSHGNGDFWILKLDMQGKLIWQKSLGGSGYESAFSVHKTSDQGYIIAGTSDSNDGDVTDNHNSLDFWIVKIDSFGNIQWQRSLGGSGVDEAFSIQQTYDGGYITTGYSNSVDGDVTGNHGDYDYWVVKLNPAGFMEWEKSFGGSGTDFPNSIRQTAEGGYIIAGLSTSTDGDVSDHHDDRNAIYNNDYWVIKLNSDGKIKWEKSLGGSGDDWGRDIIQTPDKGYVVAGYSNSFTGDVRKNFGGLDYWISKLDSIGNLQWQKSYGGSNDDFANRIIQAKDGGYIVAGFSESNDGEVTGNHGSDDYWIIKISERGKLEGQMSLGGSSQDELSSVVQANNGNIVVGGSAASTDGDVTDNHGYYDYWIVRLEPEELDSQSDNEIAFNNGDYSTLKETFAFNSSFFSVSPAITNTSLNIRLQTPNDATSAIIEIINPLGQLIVSKRIKITDGRLQAPMHLDAGIPKGMYYIRVKVGNQHYVEKFYHS